MGVDTVEKTLEELEQLQKENMADEDLYSVISRALGASALPRMMKALDTDTPTVVLKDLHDRFERYIVEYRI